jgi:hypothetical protein
MDKYYGNVCELDIIFSFTKAYYILDEILLAGELQESSKKAILRCIGQQDSLEDMEVSTQRSSAVWRCSISKSISTDTFTLPFRSRTRSRRSCSECMLYTVHGDQQWRQGVWASGLLFVLIEQS